MDGTSNKAFSNKVENIQLAWDSTSLGLLKECPWKYYLSIICGFEPRSAKHDLTFGIAYHECLEKYDHEIARGADHDSATIVAVHHALVISGSRDAEDKWIPWDDSVNPNKTRFILVRAIVWYLEQFGAADAAKTIILASGSPAVELSFRFEAGADSVVTGEPLIFCGHMDRAVEYLDGVWCMDRKTTKYTLTADYFAKYTPDNQMSMYSLAGQVVYKVPMQGVIIDAVQLAIGFCRYMRGFAYRTPAMLEEWRKDSIYWINFAHQCAKADFWPQNDKACNMYGKCTYRDSVCSKDPSVRTQFLESNFNRRIWDPLTTRGGV